MNHTLTHDLDLFGNPIVDCSTRKKNKVRNRASTESRCNEALATKGPTQEIKHKAPRLLGNWIQRSHKRFWLCVAASCSFLFISVIFPGVVEGAKKYVGDWVKLKLEEIIGPAHRRSGGTNDSAVPRRSEDPQIWLDGQVVVPPDRRSGKK